MIEVSELAKYYGDFTAVENVTFRAEKGEILGFLGPNGAGKTTTMRMLTCFLPPSGGRASVAGFDVVDESMEVRKRIGYLPEQPPVYNDMTVQSYLRFVAKIKGVSSAGLKGAVDGVMEKVGLTDRRDSVIGHLSKGYRQRVGLGQALVHEPDVLILDEPTVGLDPNQIIEIREVIKGLKGDHTIILSTHILSEVSMTCEKVVIINNGRIVGEGTPESLTAQMREGEVLRAQISGPTESVEGVLRSIEGVVDVVLEGAAEADGDQVYLVTSQPDRDIREQLVRKLVENGFALKELRALDITLEEVFRRLTTEEVVV
ncbi:MAG: MFS transporter [Gemmatimonadetes bacterium]|nr:MFS transporter [Gemmatimonadota bacterium]